MKRFLVFGAGLLALGGCALPVPVQVASWALDGILYVTTEKSAADHGLSMIAQKDCAVLRSVLTDGEVCRDGYDAETLIVDAAGASDVPGPSGLALGISGDGGPAVAAAAATETPDDIQALANFDTAAGGDTAAVLDLPDEIVVAFDAFGNRAAIDGLDIPAAFDAFGDPMSGYPLVVGPSALPIATTAGPAPVRVAFRDDSDFEAAIGFAGFQTAADVTRDSVPAVELAEDGTVVSDAVPAEGGDAQSAPDWQAVATPAAMTTDAGSEPAAGLYFVIGSFRKHDNALDLRQRYARLTPAVLAADLEGGTVFRVVVGPFDIGQAKGVHQKIFDAGISDSWAIQVRPGEWSMAMIDPPAEAPEVAALEIGEASAWNPMTYVRMLARMIY